MLYFVGLGLEQSPTLSSIEILRKCQYVFYESYTSPIVNQEIMSDLKRVLVDSSVENVKREYIEDGKRILDLAKTSDIALVCSGDPMVATTHQELRTRALKQGTSTKIIHGSSVLCAVAGELGLHSYSFGKTVTMTREPLQYSAYHTVFRNLLSGLHTTILLEWDESHNFFLTPKEAVRSLLAAEKDVKYGCLDDATILLVASRIGTKAPSVRICRFKDIETIEIGEPPHVMVIPGKLHFTEIEALSAITGASPEIFLDNSSGIERIAHRMVTKYSEKTLAALARARIAAASASSKVKFEEVFENVECYTDDALRFLNEGREELAVLSIGYAEGLLDSLRFGGLLEFEW